MSPPSLVRPIPDDSSVASPGELRSATDLGTDLEGALNDGSRASPAEVMAWAIERWSGRLVLATSLQAEGLVLLDMAHRRLGAAGLAGLRLVTLDTGRLPQETYDLIERVRERYGVEIEIHAPDPEALAQLVARRGPNLFYRSPSDRRACCRIRKIEPLGRALEGAAAWITGLRRDQAPSRAETPVLSTDTEHDGIAKISPLVEWTWEQVWAYVRRHEVPYHPFYDRGYTSIGCAPCTRAVRPWEDRRAGRWWWEDEGDAKECGLHWVRPTAETSSDRLPIVSGPLEVAR